ncbi:MAG: 5-formyltetrahydrofolate cyclo-ligase [Vampirovibrio sp.]|nr:5-formyltetrahydrofolate cyclo-ligase [Vampirovibrio sp.]
MTDVPNKTLDSDKREARKKAKQLRLGLDTQGISQHILQQLAGLPEFRAARQVLAYYPLSAQPFSIAEIDLLPLMTTPEGKLKAWFLPRMQPQERLTFHRYKPGDLLESGAFNVQEPAASSKVYQCGPQSHDMLLLPGLAYDTSGHRLGYGKGYYDRFIAGLPAFHSLTLVGSAPEALVWPSLPADEWDQPVDILVTETQVYRPKRQ